MDTAEFQESNSITFEWTLRGLKNLFESRCVCGCHVPRMTSPVLSKGETKSKVTKSTKFGGGRWQVRRLARSYYSLHYPDPMIAPGSILCEFGSSIYLHRHRQC